MKVWDNANTSHALRRILKRPGTEAGAKYYNKLTSRRAAATLAQLRTGHCSLNYYLHRFKLVDTPHCSCKHGKETVEHYLLECRLYAEQRKKLRKNVGAGRMKIEKLLGSKELAKHTIEFVASTKGL